MKKIIHILPHSTPETFLFSKEPLDDDPFIELNKNKPPYRLIFGKDNWHYQVARETLKRTKEYELECWSPEIYADKIYTKKIDGITHRLFPSKKVKIGKYSFGEHSPLMIKELRKEVKDRNVLVHLHTVNSMFAIRIFKKIDFFDIPLIGQHHWSYATWPPLYKYSIFRLSKSKKNITQQFDYIFVLNNEVKKEFEKYIEKERVAIQTMGVNFDEFKPIDKMDARKELQLPMDKKIILSTGRLVKWKGVDKVIKALPNIINEYGNVYYIVVYRTSDKEYEQEIKTLINDLKLNSNIKLYKNASKEKLSCIYSASDLFVLSSNKEPLGIVYIEALACNLPIIATNNGGLFDILGNEKELIFIDPNNIKEIEKSIARFLERSKDGNKINYREIAKKSFSWDRVIENTLKKYEMVFRKYEGRKQ